MIYPTFHGVRICVSIWMGVGTVFEQRNNWCDVLKGIRMVQRGWRNGWNRDEVKVFPNGKQHI